MCNYKDIPGMGRENHTGEVQNEFIFYRDLGYYWGSSDRQIFSLIFLIRSSSTLITLRS